MRGRITWAAFLIVLLIAVPMVVWASHQFVDVPDSHVFHDDVAWLADNGVTLGCNPPDNDRFCPDEEVTRGEMAAFMRRLAEGGVVDAGAVGGLSADELGGVISENAIFDKTFPADAGTELYTVDMVAPRDGGALTITADIALTTSGGGGTFWTEVDIGTCNDDRQIPRNSESGFWVSSKGTDSGTVTWSVPVSRGPHTVSMCLWSTDEGSVLTSSVSVSWAPQALSTSVSHISPATISPSEVAEHLSEATAGGGQR